MINVDSPFGENSKVQLVLYENTSVDDQSVVVRTFLTGRENPLDYNESELYHLSLNPDQRHIEISWSKP